MALWTPAKREMKQEFHQFSVANLRTAVGNMGRPVLALIGLYLLWIAYLGQNFLGMAMMVIVMMLLFVALPFVECEREVQRRAWCWWGAYVFSFVGFAFLRSFADQDGRPIYYTYPIRIVDWLFGGEPLVVRLQHLMPAVPRSDPFTLLMVGTYLSFFAVPTLVALYLGRRRPEDLPRFVTAVILSWGIGLVFFYLFPTAPPWMAARDGFVSPVYRVDALVIDPAHYSQGLHLIGINDVAAMPSIHVALTWLAILGITDGRRRLFRAVGIIYGCAMIVAVMYLGEHWFVDVVAGLALMAAAWRLALVPLRQRWSSPESSLAVETVPQQT